MAAKNINKGEMNMFCKNCGNELKDDEKFCGKCGQRISDKIVKNDVANKKEPIKIKFTHLMIVIGIVVIVAGVAISMNISSDNGLMKKAQNANDNYKGTNSIISKKTLYDIENIKPIEGNSTSLIEGIGIAALLEDCSEEKQLTIQNSAIEMTAYIINENLIGVYIHYSVPEYVNKGYEMYGVQPKLTGYYIQTQCGVVKVNDIDVFLKNNRGTMRTLMDNGTVEVVKGDMYNKETFLPSTLNSGVSSIMAEEMYDIVKNKEGKIKEFILKMAKDENWIE